MMLEHARLKSTRGGTGLGGGTEIAKRTRKQLLFHPHRNNYEQQKKVSGI